MTPALRALEARLRRSLRHGLPVAVEAANLTALLDALAQQATALATAREGAGALRALLGETVKSITHDQWPPDFGAGDRCKPGCSGCTEAADRAARIADALTNSGATADPTQPLVSNSVAPAVPTTGHSITRYPLCAHHGCPTVATERHEDPVHGAYGYCRPCEQWERVPHFSDCNHGSPAGPPSVQP